MKLRLTKREYIISPEQIVTVVSQSFCKKTDRISKLNCPATFLSRSKIFFPSRNAYKMCQN